MVWIQATHCTRLIAPINLTGVIPFHKGGYQFLQKLVVQLGIRQDDRGRRKWQVVLMIGQNC